MSVTPSGRPSSWPPPAQGWAPQPPPARSRSLIVVIVLSIVVALLAVAVLVALLLPRDRTVTSLDPPARVGNLARAEAVFLTEADAEKAVEQGAKQAVAVAYGEGVLGAGGFDVVLALEAPPDAVATIRGTSTGSAYQQDGFEVICGSTVLGVGATCFWQADGVTAKADATTLEPDELATLTAELHRALRD